MKFITFLIKLRNKIKEKFYLDYLNPFFSSKKISIRYWYGGFGNNLIQIANILLFANFFNLKIKIPIHRLLNNEKIKSLNSHSSSFSKSQTFFSLSFDNLEFRKYYLENLQKIFKTKVFDLFSFYKDLNLQNDELVIHLRPMAIVSNQTFKLVDLKARMQNPISYYLEIIPKYKKITIVIDNVLSNPILPLLVNYPNVHIQSGTEQEDFNYLLNAKNLMLSTNSSFAYCAALSSRNLETIYFSDINYENKFIKAIKCSNIYKINLIDYLSGNDSYNLNEIYKKMLCNSAKVTLEKVDK